MDEDIHVQQDEFVNDGLSYQSHHNGVSNCCYDGKNLVNVHDQGNASNGF